VTPCVALSDPQVQLTHAAMVYWLVWGSVIRSSHAIGRHFDVWITINCCCAACYGHAADTSSHSALLMKGQMFAEGSEAGDGIFMEGQAPGTTFPKTLKSDFWKKIVADLQVHSHIACCAKQKLVTAKGPVHLPSTIPDGAGIH